MAILSSPEQSTEAFYDHISDLYHLTQADWTIWLQANEAFLKVVLRNGFPRRRLRILDAAAGIGSQSIPLSRMGHDLIAADLSQASLDRLSEHRIETRHCAWRSLKKTFQSENSFDFILIMDNAIAHTVDTDELGQLLADAAELLAPGGQILISIRDYDVIRRERPTNVSSKVKSPNGYWQEWHWISDDAYISTWYMNGEAVGVVQNRVVTQQELNSLAEALSLRAKRVEGYFQPAYCFTKKSDIRPRFAGRSCNALF